MSGSSMSELSTKDFGRQLLRKCQWSVRYYGVDLTLCGALPKMLGMVWGSTRATNWYKDTISKRFDTRFNVDTSGYISVEDLDFSQEQRSGAFHYQPTAAVMFGVVISQLGINYRDYVFIDYGSGKGRTLVQAALFPFKAVIGVELSRRLHEVAEKNVERLTSVPLKCREISSICEDATTYAPPNEKLVLYLLPSVRRIRAQAGHRHDPSFPGTFTSTHHCCVSTSSL